MTLNQSVFIAKYYSANKDEPIIYLEGAKPVLPNMASLLQEAGLKNLTVAKPPNIQFWLAGNMENSQAILVGSKYGQDALSVSSYAALTGAPIYFINNPSQSSEIYSQILSHGYSKIIIYGTIAQQIPQEQLALFPQRDVIDTGSRYSNNIEIAKRFLAIRPSEQAMFVSGHTFEKSMVDTRFPILLVGRSDVPAALSSFVKESGIKNGIVFAGDSDIVDGMARLRQDTPDLAVFVKFGEGYKGVSQPLPLMVVSLPSPKFSLEVLNLTYNVPQKLFELKIKNSGDFCALSAGASIDSLGSSQSSQIFLDSGAQTTLSIPLDASRAIADGQVPLVTIAIKYGEDAGLMDNIDTIAFTSVPTSFYQDESAIQIKSISYSSEKKAFLLLFDGNGWVEGTLGFNINNVPIVLRIPLSEVDGPTLVEVKYLLSSDEEKFIQSLPASFFFRYGQRSDILLKESRVQSKISLISADTKTTGIGFGDFSISPFLIFVFVLAIVAAIFFYKKFFGGKSDAFD